MHSQPGVKIHVENHNVILRGNADESTGCVLRGCVVLHLREKTRLKSLKLRMVGRMRVHWNERVCSNRWSSTSVNMTVGYQHQRHNKHQFDILDDEWVFLPLSNTFHVLPADTYKFPFEMVLPGNTIESVNDNSYGDIYYKLKAVAERPALQPNFVDRIPLNIIRQWMPSANQELALPSYLWNDWDERLHYRIMVPKKVYRRGEMIPLEFTVLPRQGGAMRIRYLTCVMKEYTTFVMDEQMNSKRTESRIVRFIRDEEFPGQGSEQGQKTETFAIPRSAQAIQHDIHHPLFTIEHKLQFTMCLVNEHGEKSELRASMPITIVDESTDANLSQHNHDHILPPYEEAYRSTPYEPATAMYCASSSQHSTPTSEPDAWLPLDSPYLWPVAHDREITTSYFGPLPSYGTVMDSSSNLDLFALGRPPSYDVPCATR
ncbi:uncharacterized protein BYT42DRAFT_643206 [Radiomyces spectabilis]|uniref:uncharacterized protein n=1 Tax=Radiomyces spectabilis TaxID=64574 RepID=UPI00221F578F|nr:uncharacterized protein BYT42DRAFT_643206 [Radiomyces spectabilis]KAI8384385.1 hypothetical protein BYT42DRAFT_643206 [Radiomyces spectabilis]